MEDGDCSAIIGPIGLEQLEGCFLHQKAALSCAWAQALIYQSQPRTAESRMTMGLATPRPVATGLACFLTQQCSGARARFD